jgi:hypothetical protein
VTWTNRSAWFRLYRRSGPGSFDDFCRRVVADSPRPVLLVGLPELRELTALSRASAGRLLLWSDEAGDLR